MKGESLTPENIAKKFKARVDRAAGMVRSVGNSVAWCSKYGLPADAVSRGIEHLQGVLKEVSKSASGGEPDSWFQV